LMFRWLMLANHGDNGWKLSLRVPQRGAIIGFSAAPRIAVRDML